MDFQEAVADFVVARIEATTPDLYAANVEFLEAGQTYQDHYDAINENLSEEMQNLLDELNSAKNRIMAAMEETIYQLGFRDCIALLKLLG